MHLPACRSPLFPRSTKAGDPFGGHILATPFWPSRFLFVPPSDVFSLFCFSLFLSFRDGPLSRLTQHVPMDRALWAGTRLLPAALAVGVLSLATAPADSPADAAALAATPAARGGARCVAVAVAPL